MGKFKNKYRSETTRLQKWNYGWNAAYFVTICTKNRIHFLGNIINGENNLSEIGEMANKYWLEIPNHFPFVKLGAFVIMPNHVHGIVIIDKKNNDGFGVLVDTQNFAYLPQQKQNKFGPQSQNLASIIRGYKIGVTKYANNNNIGFAWQSRYYDHIIRDNISFSNIENYIINNPKKWNNDKFFTEGNLNER